MSFTQYTIKFEYTLHQYHHNIWQYRKIMQVVELNSRTNKAKTQVRYFLIDSDLILSSSIMAKTKTAFNHCIVYHCIVSLCVFNVLSVLILSVKLMTWTFQKTALGVWYSFRCNQLQPIIWRCNESNEGLWQSGKRHPWKIVLFILTHLTPKISLLRMT